MEEIPILNNYPLRGTKLGSGSFGDVFKVRGVNNQIVKVINLEGEDDLVKSLIQEVTIQKKLSEKLPGSCPNIYEFGKVKDREDYVVVMEQCEGTARSLFQKTDNSDAIILDYMEQVATILKNAEPFGFNHRDLKSDNVMYKTDVGNQEIPQKKFLLIDFGFACATFDGIKYEGTLYFDPGIKCFRKSRDLAMLVFELLQLGLLQLVVLSQNMRRFIQLVLTFDYKGKKCDMSVGCLPDFNGQWLEAYKFLDNDKVENPNTTPDGLLNAIKVYREGGIKACEGGFILNDKCISNSEPLIVNNLESLKTPGKGHVATPVVVENPKSTSESSGEVEKGGRKKHRTTRRRGREARTRRKTLRHKRRTYRKPRGIRSM